MRQILTQGFDMCTVPQLVAKPCDHTVMESADFHAGLPLEVLHVLCVLSVMFCREHVQTVGWYAESTGREHFHDDVVILTGTRCDNV